MVYFSLSKRLVRMRSAVRICLTTVEKHGFRKKTVLFYSLFNCHERLLFVVDDPRKEFLVFHTAVSYRQTNRYKLVVRALDADPVYLQKRKHDINANPFIPIHKCMVRYQRISKPRTLFFLAWVKLLIAKPGKRAFECRARKPFIPRIK